MATQTFFEGQTATNPDTGQTIVWSKKGGWGPAPAAGGPAAKPGFDAALTSPDYTKKVAQERAALDVKTLADAQTSEAGAFQTEQVANRAKQVLKNAPTGPFADQRIALGRALGPVMGGVLGIPTPEQTTNLEQLKTMGSEGILANVHAFPSRMTDRDLAVLKTMQYDAGASLKQNQLVQQNQEWAAQRNAAYAAAIRHWTAKLGSPTAPNANGLTFPAWWGQWSEQNMPRPGTAPATARDKANAALKAKSKQPVLLGYEGGGD